MLSRIRKGLLRGNLKRRDDTRRLAEHRFYRLAGRVGEVDRLPNRLSIDLPPGDDVMQADRR